MKALFLSFVFGLGVGVLYRLIRVKSPASPIVALLGLLGMVLGEQLGIWMQTKKLDVPVRAREAIMRIGLFGATGELSLASVQMEGLP